MAWKNFLQRCRRMPHGRDAWQYHPDNPNFRVRTWPVYFATSDRFARFIDRVTQLGYQQTIFYTPGDNRRDETGHYSHRSDFLAKSIQADLSSITLQSEGVFSMYLNPAGEQVGRTRIFMQITAKRPSDIWSEWLEDGLSPLERIVEETATPVSRWERWSRKPALFRGNADQHDDLAMKKRIRWQAAGISLTVSVVVAAVGAYLNGLLG